MPLLWQKSRRLWLSAAGAAIVWVVFLPSGLLWSAESKKARASRQYNQALQLLRDFKQVPQYELGPRQYLLVAKAFRKVYLISPASSYSDDSLLSEAEMYRGIAVRFRSKRRRVDALKTYRFLVREYPYSKLKSVALEAIADMEGYAEPRSDRNESLSVQKAASQESVGVTHKVLALESSSLMPTSSLQNSDSPRERGDALFSVDNIRFWSHENVTRIVIDVDDHIQYQFERLKKPERIFVDLLKSRIGPQFSKNRLTMLPVKDKRVRQIRVAQNRRTTVRVVFDLNQSVHPNFQWLTNPRRLVIELKSDKEQVLVSDRSQSAKGQDAVTTSFTDLHTDSLRNVLPPSSVRRFVFEMQTPKVPMKRHLLSFSTASEISLLTGSESMLDLTEVTKFSRKKFKVLLPPQELKTEGSFSMKSAAVNLAQPPKAASATSRGKRNMTRALGLKIDRVVIDAGHGGRDTGTIGKGGLREKDVVIDISRRLGRLIETKLHADVIYTRSKDRFISLRERTKLANHSGADLFISVHANSSRLRSIRGVETYYLSFTTNQWALDVASRENAAGQRSIHELESLLSKIALTEKIEESREFASKVQSSLYGGLAKKTRGLSNRGVRKAPFMVLIGAKMPAVLAEIGFLSNPHDEKLLKSSSYRQEVAKHLFEGISGYADTLSKVTLTQKNVSGTQRGVD